MVGGGSNRDNYSFTSHLDGMHGGQVTSTYLCFYVVID